MIKTQIQMPEDLYLEIKSFAEAREWSLAETFRRGAELLLEVYDSNPLPPQTEWQVPVSTTVGWQGRSSEELRELAWQDMEPVIRVP